MSPIFNELWIQFLIGFITSRLPAYLTQSPHLIFQALSQPLNCELNKKDEQMFVHLRLQLFDRQYRLDVDQHLWQSCLDLGCQEKFWPVNNQFFLLHAYGSFSNDSFVRFLASTLHNGQV